MGIYANSEAITKTFVEKHFYTNNNSFFFCDLPGGNLRYKGPDSTLYYQVYTIKSGYGWADLLNLCLTLKSNPSAIENILDVDRTLWMIAFTNMLVALDSYIGQPAHNYYLYKDHNGRFNPIVWDLNGSFGIFNKPAQGVSLSTAQMQNLSPLLHANDTMWPLVRSILSVPMYKKMYIAHAKTIIDENFSDSSYYFKTLQFQSVIDSAFQADPNKFYTHQEFLNNIYTTVVDSDGKVIVGITELMEARKNFLGGTPDFQKIPPSLSSINVSDTFPALNSSITITAQVTNATVVFCGMRNSVMEKFTRLQMYDDGLHGDGAASDGTFGIITTIAFPELHYFIYAENNNAGIFLPQRAEYEYFVLKSDYATVNSGEIVINELMAMNAATQTNGAGNYGDWIELYNNTSDTVLLDNLNLSDDITNPAKWQFPSGTSIPPANFLIVWADNDLVSNELHSGYKLSGTGEQLILSYANGKIIDSLSFPLQSTDLTWGRLPNGTGNFTVLAPTFNAENMMLNSESAELSRKFLFHPNPSSDFIFVDRNNDFEIYTIKNVLGEIVFSGQIIKSEKSTIDLRCFSGGVYFFTLHENQNSLTEKIIICRY